MANGQQKIPELGDLLLACSDYAAGSVAGSVAGAASVVSGSVAGVPWGMVVSSMG